MFEDWTTSLQQSDSSSTSKAAEQTCKHKGPGSSLMKQPFSNGSQKDMFKKTSTNKLAIRFPTTTVAYTPAETVLYETHFFIYILTYFCKGKSSNCLKKPLGLNLLESFSKKSAQALASGHSPKSNGAAADPAQTSCSLVPHQHHCPPISTSNVNPQAV